MTGATAPGWGGVLSVWHGEQDDRRQTGRSASVASPIGNHTVTETVPDRLPKADGDNPKTVNVAAPGNVRSGGAQRPSRSPTSPLTDVDDLGGFSKTPGGTDANVNCSNDSLDFDTPNATGDGTATASNN